MDKKDMPKVSVKWRKSLKPGDIVIHKARESERLPVMLIEDTGDGTFMSTDMQTYYDSREHFYPATEREIQVFEDAQRMFNRIQELMVHYRENSEDDTGMRLLFYIESHFGDDENREITQIEKDYISHFHVLYIREQEREIRESRDSPVYYRCRACGYTAGFPHHCLGCGCAGLGDDIWYDLKLSELVSCEEAGHSEG